MKQQAKQNKNKHGNMNKRVVVIRGEGAGRRVK